MPKIFLKFIETHCHLRQYCFQIKKCEDHACCPSPRLSTEVFESIHWLPDPTLTADRAHFKTFKELYRKETNDTDCPSLAFHRERENEPAALFTAAKVRGIVHCMACDKPWCLYCDKQAVYAQNRSLMLLAIENNFYTCGSPILPASHPLSGVIRIRTSLTCTAPVESSYFSNTTLRLPQVCAHCGEKDCTVPTELQKRYKQVLPICKCCSDKNLQPITYMPIKVGSKRKN